MSVIYDWTAVDAALDAVANIIGVQQFVLSGPSNLDWGVARMDATPSLRAAVTVDAGTPDYWWTSAEVEVDIAYSQDGTLFEPDIEGRDSRILWAGQLYPRLMGVTTSTANKWRQHIVWAPDGVEVQSQTKRAGAAGHGNTPGLIVTYRALDQFGVFATGTTLATRCFAFNAYVAGLWYRPA